MIYNYPKIFFLAPKYRKSDIFLLSNIQEDCCKAATDDNQNVGRL